MNKAMNLFMVVCAFTFLFTSCSKELSKSVANGNLQFSISSATNFKSMVASDSTGVIDTTTTNYYAMITLTDQSGNVIYNSKLISLYSFGSQFLSENISLPVGSYQLTQFVILKGSVAIYATPVSGSVRAQLVQTPLPLSITVTANNTTQVAPQVLAIDNSSPELFGYTSFSFSVVNTVVFKMIVYGNTSFQNDTMPISARLQVVLSSGSDSVQNLPTLNYFINPSVTSIEVNDAAYYFLTVNSNGYSTLQQKFSFAEIENYISTPLIIHLTEQSDTLTYHP